MEEFSAVSDWNGEFGGLRKDGSKFDGIINSVVGGLYLILDNGPLARLGPMGARKIRYSHASKKQTERDNVRNQY